MKAVDTDDVFFGCCKSLRFESPFQLVEAGIPRKTRILGAEALGISERTLIREWQFAKAWLAREMNFPLADDVAPSQSQAKG